MRNFMLEDVPAGWSISRLGHLFEERSEKVSDQDFQALSVTYDGIVPQLAHVAKSEDRGNRKKVLAGDLVINSRSDRRGASGMSPLDGSVSLINIVLKPRKGTGRFFHYLLRSKAFQEEFYRRGRGIVDDLWTTRLSELKNIEVAIPNEEEQSKIVDRLDNFTQNVARLTEKKTLQIKALGNLANSVVVGESKSTLAEGFPQSKVPWLNGMPSGWKLMRAKHLFKNVNRPPFDYDDVVTAFRDGQVTLRRNRRETGYTFAEKEVGYQHIKTGDLVIHTMDAFAGAIGVSDSDGKATGEYAVCIARNESVNLEYYAQLLRCLADAGYIFVLCPSVRERAPRFRYSKLAPVFLPVPPLSEQDKLAETTSEIHKTQRKVRESIQLLKSVESTVVNDVVLGHGATVKNTTTLDEVLA